MADEKMNNAEDAAAKDDAIKDNEHSAETAASVGAEDDGSPA